MAPMAIDSVPLFVDALRQSRLLDAAQQGEVDQLRVRFTDPRALARELIQRGWLTPYQVNQLMQGHGQELVLGTSGGATYRVLERIGAGGMGQVFKAKHSALDKLVALKVIRREHLAKPDAVHRFRREIRAVSKLSHPNIVMATDADTDGETHFYVMEYVDGSDLSKLVRESGPLPIPQAIDFMKQAARGLEHASAQGLVHRDIKPANLLIGRPAKRPSGFGNAPSMGNAAFTAGTVKLLDMGLAKLISPDDNNSMSWRTQDGKVVGTPEYMAPEQALKSSEADVRADLYSLGCTFYFALSGRVPFPGGTLMEKLLKHKMDTATPIETLRPEIPRALGDILRKLMAKNPTDRYQTPAELIAALDALSGAAPSKPVAPPPTGPTALTVSDATAEEIRNKTAPAAEGITVAPTPLPIYVWIGGAILLLIVLFVLLH
jgi:serine/threonine-protein kinase